MSVRLLVLPGSLRARSYNVALARCAIELAPDDVEAELYDRLRAIPPYDADVDGSRAPAAVRDLRERIARADAVLFVTPEYNGSVPGVLKNAVDWASRPREGAALAGKTVAVTGVSTGQYGALWAQQDLRRILGIAGARVVGGELPVARAEEVFDEHGRLRDSGVEERLRTHLVELVREATLAPLVA
ncbi:MAG: NAD(P)H-dependent oxidoreductase [Thermoleophilia bacterium]|nr:NAD(P)H-dependent oxidoreductase [Gaiellaceae bacterium]MDW8338967.1 NAD(P)H-dependent oxidoreductase [Thermoleophilia bacterium]